MKQTNANGRALIPITRLASIIVLTSALAGCNWDPLKAVPSPGYSPGDFGPVFTSAPSISVPEGSFQDIYTATADDPNRDTLSFSLAGGVDEAMFNIDATSGVLSFNAPVDFENPSDSDNDNNYLVELQVDDSSGQAAIFAIRVEVTNVNEVPLFTSARTGIILEDSTVSYDAVAFDPDFDTLAYSITAGNDRALFNIDAVSGSLSFNSPPDYEAPADSNGDNDYVVQITADDGNGGIARLLVTISVTNGNELPYFTSANANNILENSTAAYDADALDPDFDTLAYSISGGADQALFNIDAVSGLLSFNNPPDYEAPADSNADNDYVVQITVDDGNGGIVSLIVTISVNNGNDAPFFTSPNTYSVVEDSSASYDADALDPDFDTLAYSISGGADQPLFNIDAVSGLLSFNSPPDYEAPADSNADNDYLVQITADDGNGGSVDLLVTISVTNGNEAPYFTSANSYSVEENSTAAIVMAADDPDLDVLSFSITGGADQALFNIDAVSGLLSFNSPPDYEAPADSNGDNDYLVQVTADDGNGGSASLLVTISVTNGNDAPYFTSASSYSVVENSTAGFAITADDSDLDVLSFSISGGADQALFNIDAVSGLVSFNSPPDYEAPADSNGDNDYLVQVTADDGNGGSASLLVTISVTNGNDAPYFTSASSYSVVENSTAGFAITADDPDLDVLSFGITGGDDQALFNIDAVSGLLSFNSPPDYEAPADSNADNDYEVQITVDDGNGGSASLLVTISVLDANQLELQVSFPTPNANLGDIADTMVTGNLIDLEDGIVDFDDLNFIDVNGYSAIQSIVDPSRWSVQIPAGAPDDVLTIVASSVGGGLDNEILAVENKALILFPDLISMDVDNDRLLVGDSGGLGALVSVNLTSGARTILANANTGTGVQILLPEASVHDAANNRVLVIDSILSALISLDLATGNRTLISDAITGTGPSFGNPLSIDLDASNQRALVVDAGLEALVSVDLASGNRVIVSDANVGVGPPLIFPTTVAFDGANNRALVTDVFLEALVSVDLASGDRTVVADVNTGTVLDFPISMAFDAAAGSVLVGDINTEALTSIDLLSGAGTVLSDAVTGSGPLLTYPRSIALDTATNRAFVVDIVVGEILAIDLSTGNRAVFADSITGSGPRLAGTTAVALDAGTNRALLTEVNDDGAGLVWVDLGSGDRSVLAGAGTGTGPDFDAPTAMTLDVASNRALVLDDTLDALVSVDLANGDRTIISDLNTGSGASFVSPMSLALDGTNNRALVVDDGLDALVAIDLVSGNRTVISDSGTGAGPQIASPTSVVLDESSNRALVLDSALNALLSVDLTNGNRTVIADSATGTGPAFVEPLSLAFDASNDRALVSDGRFPASLSSLLWVDLATGDRSVLSDITGLGPILLNVPSVILDQAHDRAFVVDSEIQGLVVVELSSGQRAIASQ